MANQKERDNNSGMINSHGKPLNQSDPRYTKAMDNHSEQLTPGSKKFTPKKGK